MKQISENSIAIFSSKSMSVTTSCDNERDKIENIIGFKILTLSRKCSIVTRNHFFRPSLKFYITTFIEKPLNFHPSEFITHIDSDEFKRIVDSRLELGQFHEIELGDIEQEVEKSRLESHHEITWYILPVIGAIGLVVILLAICLLYRIYKIKCRRNGNSPNNGSNESPSNG